MASEDEETSQKTKIERSFWEESNPLQEISERAIKLLSTTLNYSQLLSATLNNSQLLLRQSMPCLSFAQQVEIFKTKTIDGESYQDIVDSWEQGEKDTLVSQTGKALPATVPGGNLIGKPAFQFISLRKTFSEGGTMVFESDNCLSFIPAGFRDAPTPNTMNPVKEDIGGLSALMSFVHVLTVPKDKRIYNAVTLKPEHLPLLEEMKELGERSVKFLMEAGPEQLGSLRWVYNTREELTMEDGRKVSMEVTPQDLSLICKKNFKKDLSDYTILNSFHAYPSASIGWLHLHSYVGELLTSAHETMENKELEKVPSIRKNTPYQEVVDYLKEDEDDGTMLIRTDSVYR